VVIVVKRMDSMPGKPSPEFEAMRNVMARTR
jgi:hypothetical protein